MRKDFDKWNTLKKKLHYTNRVSPKFREREIWWCSLGLNIGFEQDGKNNLYERPVLVLKKYSADLVLILPLSSKNKINKYYLPTIHNKLRTSILLSQARVLSTKRFLRRIRKMNTKEFENIKFQFFNSIKTEPVRAPRVPYGNL